MTNNTFLKGITFILFLVTLSIVDGCRQGGRTTRFSDVVATDLAPYDNYLIKLKFMGPQTAQVITLVFGSSDSLDITRFQPYQRPNYNYQNDALGDFAAFSASSREMEAIIKALDGTQVYQDAGDKSLPVLSMMIMCDVGQPKETVFETLTEYGDAAPLLRDYIIPNLDPANNRGRELCQFWLKNVGG